MRLARAGRLALIGVIATIAASCSVASNPLADKLHVTADFENIAGMYVGNDVSVLGMPIGKVDKITPKGTVVEVEMSISADTKVPADAIAASVSPSVVTDRHLELTPVYRGNGPTLADGDHIPLDRTRTPVELDRVISALDSASDALKGNGKAGGPLSGQINAFDSALSGNGDKIRNTLDALSSALKLGVDNKDAISNAIVKANELTQMIADNDQTVRQFSSGITNLTQILADQAPGLQAVMTQLNDFLGNTSAVLEQNRGQLGGAMTRLTDTTNMLRKNARNLTESVDLLPLTFQNIDNAMSPETGNIRLHILTDKAVFDGELLNLFCERIQMRVNGCRTGKLEDFGPDFGLTAALLGMSK
ncbi:MCE family protein [Antrihabitans cavernicola]|uniref:MCE family protein n=1 Tax=Antrihabitans cavernicola TaxID=2495913 RepID=A0A5A7S934_9NOCA|nr:MCE family protein [Spelaeibacter cavernicola]KAA0019438.1 MCE family protein [Spelaeibacter cavernicola]